MIIDSPIISGSYAASGSLSQFGNVTITGSLTVTGPIIGTLTGSVDSASFATTASYVSPNTQINTASFAVTSSYASTVDYNNTVITSSFAITASYVSPATQINTASFAITASYVSPATQINTSSFAITSSYAANAELLDGLDSSAFTPINSFNSYTSSNNATVTSVAASTALALASIATLTSKTGSYTLTSSFNSYTSSNDATVNCVSLTATAALVGVAALSSKTGSYATTGSNTFDGGQYFSSLFNPTGFTTTASLYTDGGLRVTKDAYISGTLYLNNVTVFGTQSVAYITSSQLNIGTNLITVNTDTPSVRFGGLAVYDSGSSGLTGSMLWDSQNNHWVYSNPSGSTYSGGMFISGPRSAALGSEQGTTSCMLLAGQGGDHLTSSMIYHSSTVTCIPTAIVGGSTACFANTVCTPSMDIMPSGIGSSTLGGIMRVVTTGTSTGIAVGQSNTNRYTHIAANDIQVFNDDFFLSTRCAFPLSIGTCYTARLTFAATGIACFACQVCAPAFVGGTISGTTGNFSGILTVAANSSANAIAINGRSADNTGTIDFFQNNGTTRVMEIGVSPTAAEFYYDSNSPMIFYTNQCERLRITSGGNVGIGTNSPNLSSGASGSTILTISATSSGRNGLLELNGTRTNSSDISGYIRFFNNSAATPLADIRAIRGSSDTSGDLAFTTADTERMRIQSDGTIRINAGGVTTSATLQFYADPTPSNGASIAVSYLGSGTYGPLTFGTGGSERMRIAANGAACFACELTAKTLGTNDLILNNLNYECANYVDGTRGSWLIQEGACDLFIINQVSCKKYKFNLIEIK
jgi:hypothetical protein